MSDEFGPDVPEPQESRPPSLIEAMREQNEILLQILRQFQELREEVRLARIQGDWR